MYPFPCLSLFIFVYSDNLLCYYGIANTKLFGILFMLNSTPIFQEYEADMKENEQKLSDLNLTKSDFQKIECGKRLKKAIEKRFKTHELFRAACQKESGIESGYEFISKHFLSQIINGKAQLPRDKAVVFSNVLGVSSGYLLGLEDYPSKDDEKIAMLKKMYSEEQSKIKNTNSKIEFALRMLCENGYGIRFEILIDTEEDSQKAFILCDNNTFTLYESSGTCIIPYSVFSEVFDYGSFTIRREGYEGYRYGQSPEKVYMKDDDLKSLLDKTDDMRFTKPITGSFMYECIFEKANPGSIINLSNRAIHPVTTKPWNKTGSMNCNFMFTTPEDTAELWKHYYTYLPSILMFYSELFNCAV